jgi:hypothetical protein
MVLGSRRNSVLITLFMPETENYRQLYKSDLKVKQAKSP